MKPNVHEPTIQNTRREAVKKGYRIQEAAATGAAPATEAVQTLNVNEKELVAEIEAIEEILGNLDGRLSLANAVTKIEI